jgi:ABC-2 type transport system ATP-binding protein
MLTIKNLTKYYGNTKVFENINLKIERGLIVGLLGMNGSGKTTLQNIIMNKTDFSGKVLLDGIQNYDFIKKQNNNILYLPDNPFVYEFLTGLEFIKFILEMRKIKFDEVQQKVELLINLFNLENYKNRLIKEYSNGMKQKITIIPVLVLKPKILLLDEPVSGLDTTSIIVLKKLLNTIAEKGTTIIFSTHILDLVEDLCDEIITLNNNIATLHKNIKNLDKNKLENLYLNTIADKLDSNIDQFKNL